MEPLATWSYRAFRVFPPSLDPLRGEALWQESAAGPLAARGLQRLAGHRHPTEAQLYRSAPRTSGVQLFDEVETLRGDEDRFDALITVLNVGFERGGVVTRLEKLGERFVEEPYEVYAPQVLAGIAGLKETLEDRALTLVMLRRQRGEDVAPIGRPTDAEAQALRDRCALACLSKIGDVLSAYELVPGALEREATDRWLVRGRGGMIVAFLSGAVARLRVRGAIVDPSKRGCLR